MWLYPLFVFPWFIILLCFLIHLMISSILELLFSFRHVWKKTWPPPLPFPLTTPKTPFLFIDRLLETGRWGPDLVRLLSHLQPAAVYKKNSDFFDLLVGKKKNKQKKSPDPRKWPTASMHCTRVLKALLHIWAGAESREPGMLSDALGSVCTATAVCRNEAVFSYFYCSRWL